MAITGAIFDCDGTLLDSMNGWNNLRNEISARAGVELTAANHQEINKFSLPEFANYFHTKHNLGTSPQDVIDMAFDIMRDYYIHNAKIRNGVATFLDGLKSQGVKLSVASSTGPELLHIALTVAGIEDYFDAIVSVEQVERTKRFPDVYNRARELMGTELSSTWVFEDSWYALDTVKNAGFHSVGIYDLDSSGTFQQLEQRANITIKEFTELDPYTFVQTN